MSITDEQLAKQLPRNHGFQPFWRLRWRFVFSDGRPDVAGEWSGTGTSAWKVDKKNLLYAIIEGEKIGSWAQKVFVEVPGADYATAKWRAASAVYNDFKTGDVGNTKHDLIGLTFQTRDEAITVFVNGVIDRRPLSAGDKAFNLREHTIGGRSDADY